MVEAPQMVYLPGHMLVGTSIDCMCTGTCNLIFHVILAAILCVFVLLGVIVDCSIFAVQKLFIIIFLILVTNRLLKLPLLITAMLQDASCSHQAQC